MKRLLKNLKENLIENCSIRLNVSHKVNHLACTIPFFKEWKLSFYLTDRTVEKRQECNSQGQWVRIKPTSTPWYTWVSSGTNCWTSQATAILTLLPIYLRLASLGYIWRGLFDQMVLE